jgi:tetratricopeptide (TPR) repeat protein
MKKIASFALLIFTLGSIPFFAQDQAKQISANPKYGPDSASRVECGYNLSTMGEFMKIDLLDRALPSWQAVFNDCPASSKNIYIYGVQIYRDRLARETDPKLKAIKLDSLMMIYDRRVENFGEEGLVIGRKALDLLRYDQSQIETAYGYLKHSAEISKVNSEAAILVTLMQTSNALFKAGRTEGRVLIDDYLTASGILEEKMKRGSETQRAAAALNNVEAIFAGSGAADCDALVEIFTPRFNETPEDLAFLKKITGLLSNQKCEGTELFASASENLYRLEPSSGSAYNLATLFFKKEEWDKSVEYYNEAIENAVNDEEQARYHYELGLILFTRYDNYQQARAHARNAIDKMPGWGEPYILIGNLYASSSEMCAENEFEKSTVFWAAVDQFEAARRVDSRVNDEATALIQKYSQYFPNAEDAFFYGLAEDQPYTVECWINENTIVRTRRIP